MIPMVEDNTPLTVVWLITKTNMLGEEVGRRCTGNADNNCLLERNAEVAFTLCRTRTGRTLPSYSAPPLQKTRRVRMNRVLTSRP